MSKEAFHKEIIESIRANALFDMCFWGSGEECLVDGTGTPECGTAMCMAGTIVSLRPEEAADEIEVEDRAAAIYRKETGLPCDLDFYGDGSVKPLGDITADDACHYLEFGEWPTPKA